MRFEVSGPQGSLYTHVSRPPQRVGSEEAELGAIVVSAGFVAGQLPTSVSTHVEEEAERYATSTGWAAYAFVPSGVGDSTGTFTPEAWIEDLQAVVAAVRIGHPHGPVVVLGYGVFGAIVPWFRSRGEIVEGVVSIGVNSLALEGDKYADLLRLMLASSVRVRPVDPEQSLPEGLSLYERCGPLSENHNPQPESAPPWLIIHPSHDREQLEHALSQAMVGERVESHYFQGDLGSISYDPRAMAVFVGWLERCL
jgi:hypothetical protein